MEIDLQDLLFTLFSVIGALGLFIFYEERKSNKEKFESISKKIAKIEESSKELSRQEFDEIKGYVKESMNTVMNSKEFRDDLKGSISEIIMHIDRNRTVGESAIFAHFESMLNDINAKLSSK